MQVKPLPLIIAIIVLIFVGGALWFILSRPASHDSKGNIPPEPSLIGAKLHIQDSGAYHEASASHPSHTPLTSSAGAQADAAATALMKDFAEKEIARFIDNNITSLTSEDISVQGLGGERKYVLDMDYDVFESSQTVSYLYHMYADTLGAHPNAYYRTFVFDTKTGEGLHLDDLFVSENYLDTLSEKSRIALKKTLGENAYVEMLEAGTTPFADNFQNFYLSGNEFVLVFPPYQVGPYAIGTQEVRIPLSELNNILRNQYR